MPRRAAQCPRAALDDPQRVPLSLRNELEPLVGSQPRLTRVLTASSALSPCDSRRSVHTARSLALFFSRARLHVTSGLVKTQTQSRALLAFETLHAVNGDDLPGYTRSGRPARSSIRVSSPFEVSTWLDGQSTCLSVSQSRSSLRGRHFMYGRR